MNMPGLRGRADRPSARDYMISYTDIIGVQRAKLVPAQAMGQMVAAGANFAGFATWLDLTAAHPDMQAFPDQDAAIELPWQPGTVWVPANCHVGGTELGQAPRNVLRRLMAEAHAMGLTMCAGIEPEFYLLKLDGQTQCDPYDMGEKPCYDQQGLMRHYGLLSEVMEHLRNLGWQPYQCDHEDGNGQFEVNWAYSDALTTADRHSFFKFMIRTIAERHGMRATFMPKPFTSLTGSGCHAHISVWDNQRDNNLFLDARQELGLSETARHFLGGIMAHGPALAAICNPTVNSYKRLNAKRSNSGSTWAPNTMTWAGDNRTHMVRVPGPGRIELRLPDGAANPYLMQAVILAAGLDGLRNGLEPGPAQHVDMFTEGSNLPDAPRLPRNLLDALRAYEADEVLVKAMGADFSTAFLKMKYAEWDSYCAHLTEWERAHTLDV